jgi:hypothetical protein
MAAASASKKDKSINSKLCAYCETPEDPDNKLKSCSRCKLVAYCGKSCQVAHWKSAHKEVCIAIEDRKPKFTNPPQPTTSSSKTNGGGGGLSRSRNDCAICLEVLHPYQTSSLPCKHSFHVDCIQSLLKHGLSAVCPLCRSDLPPGAGQQQPQLQKKNIPRTTLVRTWLDKDRKRTFVDVFGDAVRGEGAELEARKMILEIANQFNQDNSAFILMDRKCNNGQGHYIGLDVYGCLVTNLDEPAINVQYTFSSKLSAVEIFLRDEDIVSLPCSFEAQKILLAFLKDNADSLNSEKGLIDLASGILLRESFLSPMSI